MSGRDKREPAAAGLLEARPDMPAPTLEIFETIPVGYVVHAVTDHGCEPMIQPGEVAVVTDEAQLYPEHGGWYLVEHSNGKTFAGRERRVRGIDVASVGKGGHWWLHSPSRRYPGVIECADGPYDFNYLAEKMLGRVVGIYRPSSRAGPCSVEVNPLATEKV